MPLAAAVLLDRFPSGAKWNASAGERRALRLILRYRNVGM
jgi:hypothetical protein